MGAFIVFSTVILATGIPALIAKREYQLKENKARLKELLIQLDLDLPVELDLDRSIIKSIKTNQFTN